MSESVQLFVTLLSVGLMLLAVEGFIPGGIVGLVGCVCLFAAMITGFVAFGAEGGWLATGLMIVLGGIALGLWIHIFPRTPLGRGLTLREDGRDNKSVPDRSRDLVGQAGVAHTDLRPGGVALIAGTRIDVVSASGYVDSGTPLQVVGVEGSRVIVRAQRPA